MTYKVALIGLGNVGYKYDMYQNEASCLTHYSSIMNLKGFELTLAIDNDEKNRNEFEKYSKIKPISNDELSFVNQEIDVIVIATPPESHIEIINKVAKLKPRLIFCEKPLAISNREIKNIVNICSSNSINLEINYFRRFEKSSLEIKKILKNATYFRGIVFYSNGVINNGSHFIDLINFWLGKPLNVLLKKQNGLVKKTFEDLDLDFELEYSNGDVNFFSWKEKLYSNYSIRIYTDKYRIDYDINGYSTSINHRIDDPEYKGFRRLKKVSTQIENNLNEGFKPIYSKIYSDLNNKIKTDYNKSEIVPEILDKLIKQI